MFIKLIYMVPFLMALTACIYTTTAFARGDNYLNTSAYHVVTKKGHLGCARTSPVKEEVM